MAKKVTKRRRVRSSVALRFVALGALLLIAFFYYRPLQSYLHARHELSQRDAEVRGLAAEHRALERRLAASTSTEESSAKRAGSGSCDPANGCSSSRASPPGSARGGRVPSAPVEDDREIVERQLGRPPRAFLRVAARCPFGRPAVTEQLPYDESGEPFPTGYYLTCRALVAAIARLEAAGGVERWSRAAAEDAGLTESRARADEDQRGRRRELIRAGSATTGERRSSSE